MWLWWLWGKYTVASDWENITLTHVLVCGIGLALVALLPATAKRWSTRRNARIARSIPRGCLPFDSMNERELELINASLRHDKEAREAMKPASAFDPSLPSGDASLCRIFYEGEVVQAIDVPRTIAEVPRVLQEAAALVIDYAEYDTFADFIEREREREREYVCFVMLVMTSRGTTTAL
ncbi:MAG: hypothetical protein MHM6MM_002648 [Cercozoa sp. M6MM]